MPPRRRRPPRPGALTDLSPSRILIQIIILQAAFYVCAAILIVFTALVAGRGVSLDLVLNWRSLRGDITVGWMLGLCWLLNSLIWYVCAAVKNAKAYGFLLICVNADENGFVVSSSYCFSSPGLN